MPVSPQAMETLRQWVQQAQPQPTQSNPNAVRALLYGLQAFDALNSQRAFAHGAHETNPFMQPFSHGGAATMAVGFGLGDLMRSALLRHASPGVRNIADGAQAASNLAGILQTDHNMGRPAAAPAPAPTPAHAVGLPGGTRASGTP